MAQVSLAGLIPLWILDLARGPRSSECGRQASRSLWVYASFLWLDETLRVYSKGGGYGYLRLLNIFLFRNLQGYQKLARAFYGQKERSLHLSTDIVS